MKHIATIQSEFLKHARKWDEKSLTEQKRYLRKHPKTKRRVTAKPETLDFDKWILDKQFMNLQTNQKTPFDKLPEEQQKSIRDHFTQEKKHFEQEQDDPTDDIEDGDEEKTKLKKFTIMGGPGEGGSVRAENAQDAMKKYLMKYEEYSEDRANKELNVEKGEFDPKANATMFGNFQVKEETKPISERQVRRLGRKIRRDIKGAGKEQDGIELDIAKNVINSNPQLKKYFLDQNIAEDKIAEAFADYLVKPKKKEKERTQTDQFGRKIPLVGPQMPTN